MLSYLHRYHAGNAADVLKHSVLIFCLEYLKRKDTPLLCVDTHAGSGFYSLGGTAAPANREWEGGLGRLLSRPPGLPPMTAGYVTFAAPVDLQKPRYAGSPVIMGKLLRKQDRLVCFELHPGEAENLAASVKELETVALEKGAGRPVIEIRREDGFGGLKSLLPPPSRRGLVLVDPSWEEEGDYERAIVSLTGGLRRFPEGTYLIWYPLLSRPRAGALGIPPAEKLLDIFAGNRCRAELYTAQKTPAGSLGAGSPRGMYGSGLVIYNPPWTLRAALEENLPVLAGALCADTLGHPGGWCLEWKEKSPQPEKPKRV